MKRHLGRLRHRPRRDELGGIDDDKVTVIDQDLALRTVRLSDVKVKRQAVDTGKRRERLKSAVA